MRKVHTIFDHPLYLRVIPICKKRISLSLEFLITVTSQILYLPVIPKPKEKDIPCKRNKIQQILYLPVIPICKKRISLSLEFPITVTSQLLAHRSNREQIMGTQNTT